MIPKGRELMDHQLDFFSITEDLDLRPLQVGVPKQ